MKRYTMTSWNKYKLYVQSLFKFQLEQYTYFVLFLRSFASMFQKNLE